MLGLLLATTATEITLWGLFTVGITGAVSTAAGFIVKHILEKKIKKREDEKAKAAKLEQEDKQRTMDNNIKSIIKEEMAPVKESLDKLTVLLEKNSNGTLSCLRNDILTCYYKCKEKGYRNDYDYQNFMDLYEAYSEMGGNSFIHDIEDRFEKLPTKEEFRDTTVKKVSKTKKAKKVI